jgi:hypothetical protein
MITRIFERLNDAGSLSKELRNISPMHPCVCFAQSADEIIVHIPSGL